MDLFNENVVHLDELLSNLGLLLLDSFLLRLENDLLIQVEKSQEFQVCKLGSRLKIIESNALNLLHVPRYSIVESDSELLAKI